MAFKSGWIACALCGIEMNIYCFIVLLDAVRAFWDSEKMYYYLRRDPLHINTIYMNLTATLFFITSNIIYSIIFVVYLDKVFVLYMAKFSDHNTREVDHPNCVS